MVTLAQKFELFVKMLKTIVVKTHQKKLDKEEIGKYRSGQNKVAVFLKDAKKTFWFKFDEYGRATFGWLDEKTTMQLIAYYIKGLINKNPEPSIDCFVITDMDTLFRLKEGKIPYLNQKTGQTEYFKYTVLDARRMGHMSIYGEGSNVSLLKFASFLEDHEDFVKEVL